MSSAKLSKHLGLSLVFQASAIAATAISLAAKAELSSVPGEPLTSCLPARDLCIALVPRHVEMVTILAVQLGLGMLYFDCNRQETCFGQISGR